MFCHKDYNYSMQVFFASELEFPKSVHDKIENYEPFGWKKRDEIYLLFFFFFSFGCVIGTLRMNKAIFLVI